MSTDFRSIDSFDISNFNDSGLDKVDSIEREIKNTDIDAADTKTMFKMQLLMNELQIQFGIMSSVAKALKDMNMMMARNIN